MLTPFGKALRKLRIDRGLLLKDMADGINVTPSFLSSVEAGRKAIPSDLIARIDAWRPLSVHEKQELERAERLSATEVRIKIPTGASERDREAMAVLARRFSEGTSDELMAKIRSLLEKR